MPSIVLCSPVRSLASTFNLPEVYWVGTFISSISDWPNNAARYATFSHGNSMAFRSIVTRLCDRVDVMECIPVRVRSLVFCSLSMCAGVLTARRSIIICAASSLCSCVYVSMCASNA